MGKIIIILFALVLIILPGHIKSQSVAMDSASKKTYSDDTIATNTNRVLYKIQLLASKTPLAADHAFRGLNGKVSVDTVNGFYKYTTGNYTDIAEAQKCLSRVKAAGYKDAFIKTYKYTAISQNRNVPPHVVSNPVVANNTPVPQSPHPTATSSVVTTAPVSQSPSSTVSNPVVTIIPPVLQNPIPPDNTVAPSNTTDHKDKDLPAAKLTFRGYVDAYYAYYTDSVGPGKFQKFGYESPISNNFGVNQAQITASDTSDIFRATITIQYGDVARALWSPVFNYLQEANGGIKLSKVFWLDAGFFRTHIGTESMLPRDNICTSQSVISWSEPFYQSGFRLTYSPSNAFNAALYLVNGSNQLVATNKKKAAGLALTYNISDNFNIGYYNLLSDDTPDSINMSHWRLWNNIVLNLNLNKVRIVAGADYVIQQNSDIDSTMTSISYSTGWAWGTIFAVKYQCLKHFGIYGRFETYDDPQGIITEPGNYYVNNPAYQLMGETFGVEYKPTESSYMRLEGRELEAAKNEKIFYTNGAYTNDRQEVMINIGISF